MATQVERCRNEIKAAVAALQQAVVRETDVARIMPRWMTAGSTISQVEERQRRARRLSKADEHDNQAEAIAELLSDCARLDELLTIPRPALERRQAVHARAKGRREHGLPELDDEGIYQGLRERANAAWVFVSEW